MPMGNKNLFSVYIHTSVVKKNSPTRRHLKFFFGRRRNFFPTEHEISRNPFRKVLQNKKAF